ncbi:MAG TPA: cell division protein ZapB [Thermoanaerobaculia bacterium]|nr:cell division protein ZapB [Thermoanaerobaculia bacterium]
MAIDWLEQLEDRVREASERLRDLRQENGTLQERVRELEEQLAQGDGTRQDSEEWSREREEIRGRVESLARHLEGLLEE